MIKLTDLLSEVEKPEQIYNPGQGSEEDFNKKGFRLKSTKINPETGTSTSEVEYAPDLDRVAREIAGYKDKMQPVIKWAENPKARDLAKNISIALDRVSKALYSLGDLMEYDKEYKK
jgi:hypothetical protein